MYVLVHSGGSAGRFWDRLVPRLRGDTVVADMPAVVRLATGHVPAVAHPDLFAEAVAKAP
jgi:hypothetical protein